jgi:hypothetical protein
MIELTPRRKLVAAVILAVIVGFLLGTFVLTVPSPRVIGLEKATTGVTLHGITSRGATVLVFGEDGILIDAARASASGQFLFENLLPATGTNVVILRSLDKGWRASPPERVDLTATLAGPVSTSSTSSSTSTGEELPPLAIPPTSTKPKIETPTSTPDHVVEAISAVAGVMNASIAPKATQTVTVTVKDQTGALLAGANVEVVAHYPTENVTYTAVGDGVYRAKFKVPENIGKGTIILLDVTVTYEGFTSTARASFTAK